MIQLSQCLLLLLAGVLFSGAASQGKACLDYKEPMVKD